MRKEILKELLKGAKPYSTDHQYASTLEQMFWDGEVDFKGNLVMITPLGAQRFKEM